MSADRKGKYTGIDNSNYGNCWVYSDLESKNKTIKKEELNDYINNGLTNHLNKIIFVNNSYS